VRNKSVFLRWKEAVLDAAENASNIGPQRTGLLGVILPPNEWLEFLELRGFPVEPYAVPVQHPGPQPTDPNHINIWLRLEQRYTEYFNDVAIFRNKLIASLDTATKARLEGGGMGIRGQSISAIWTILIREFNELTSSEVDSLEAQLRVPFQPNQSLTDFLHSHRIIHETLAAHGQPLNEHAKVTNIRMTILGSDPQLRHMWTNWLSLWPAKRDQTFDRLANFLQSYDMNRQSNSTAMDWEYSNASSHVQPTTHSTKPDAVATAIAPLLDAIRDLLTAPKKTFNSKSKTTSRSPLSPSYCWTHGWCKHGSSDCKNPASGHKPQATVRDQQGGKYVDPSTAN
jgi:hypothetical protein